MDSLQNNNANGPPSKRRKLDDIAEEIITDDDIDEEFYRQTDFLGLEAMRRLLQSNVLVSGLGGLGVEVAKNVILSGANSVTLHDRSVCTVTDLSSQYYLSRDDVGSNRAEACCNRLSELNPRVSTTSFTGDLTEDFIKGFTIIILTNSNFQEQLWVNHVTRANNISLIITSTKGVFGQVFCDFGERFEVTDTNGEISGLGYIANITNETKGVVTCFKTKKHDLADGDFVTFRKIAGMVELNNCEPEKVSVINPYEFSIGDTTSYSKYLYGGIVEQVKTSQIFKFESLQNSFDNPVFVMTDSKKPDNSRQLHLAFRTLHLFNETHKRDPRPWNSEDSEEFVNLAMATWRENNSSGVLDVELIELFSKTCSGNVCPMNSIIGGIVAEEVVKACCGKFSPLNQWLYFDAIECLKFSSIQEEDCLPIDNRYDGQALVFGRDFQNKLGNLNLFIVGAGAIGCEIMKNCAMMGVGEINRGRIVVADGDFIQKTHLNSQFLYRCSDLHNSKSTAVANAIRQINLNTNVIPSPIKVNHDTDNVFDDDFFEGIDVVAVQGNLETRKYVDRKCIYHRKPVLQSGVFGTKCSTQVTFPLLTQSYSCSHDPSEVVDVGRSQELPYTTEEVLYWARHHFEILFNQSAQYAQMYLHNRLIREITFANERSLEVFECVKRTLVDDKTNTFQDCLFWARKTWEGEFVNHINNILLKYPPDKMLPFWLPPRQCPSPLCFSVETGFHIDYITTAANLRAKVFGISQNYNKDFIIQCLKNTVEPKMLSSEPTNFENSHSSTSYRNRLNQLLLELPSKEELQDLKITPIEFDPDNDSHINFIVAAANLRAANFGIEPADRRKARLVVANFIPSIITTSSVVAGLVGLELIKLTQGIDNDVSDLKNGYVNLALPFFDFAEPLAPTSYTYNDTTWTIWDRFEIVGELSLEQFLHYFQSRDLTITMVHHGSCVLYSEFFSLSRLQEIRKLLMSQVLRKMSGQELKPNVRTLMFNLVCTDIEHKDVEVPHVRYILPPAS